jgi:F5/8 type C domain
MKTTQIHRSHFSHRKWLVASGAIALTIAGLSAFASAQNPGITLYDAPDASLLSSRYSVRIKPVDTTNPVVTYQYASAKVLESDLDKVDTIYKANNSNQTIYQEGSHAVNRKYYRALWNCSHSYLNFEMNKPVVIEVTKITGPAINSVKIYPANKVSNVSFTGNVATFIMSQPCNIAVDFNGEMENRSQVDLNAPPAVHTLSIHGNPPLDNKPSESDSNVQTVNAQIFTSTNTISNMSVVTPAAFQSNKDTMFFKKGVHNIGNNFKVFPGKKYYIPGDAIVYGTFNNIHDISVSGNPSGLSGNDSGTGIWIYGHGTISGDRLNHWELDKVVPNALSLKAGAVANAYPSDGVGTTEVPASTEGEQKYVEQQAISYRKSAIEIDKCNNSKIQGLVIVNPANHSLRLQNYTLDSTKPNEVSWLKVFGWRVNTDGGGINDSSSVNNCFYRVQDDGFYPKGVSLRDNVLWCDANGVSLRLSHLQDLKTQGMLNAYKTDLLRVEDIDVIFRRNVGFSRSGAFELPLSNGMNQNEKFVFSNINVSDPKPTKPAFNIQQGANSTLTNLRFENINVEAMPPVIANLPGQNDQSHLNTLFTDIASPRMQVSFHNLMIRGVLVDSSNWTNYFKTTRTNDQNFVRSEVAGRTDNGTITFTSSLLDRTGWGIITTPVTGTPGNMIDSSKASRWETNTNQVANGQSVIVDMINPKIFDRIVLDSVAASDDYPRGYVVSVGNTVTGPWVEVTRGSGSGAVTVITFTPQTAQCFKIDQNGSAAGKWWSIYDLSVFESDALSRTGWVATASHQAGAPGQAIDGNPNTRWSLGTSMTSNVVPAVSPSTEAGHWFKVDMVNSVTFDRIVMDSTGSIGDHARGYEVMVSNDNTSWNNVPVIATGQNLIPKAVITFLQQKARYVRVRQTGDAPGKWWSIHEFNVYKPRPEIPVPAAATWTTSKINTSSNSFATTDATSSNWTIFSSSGDISGGSDSFVFNHRPASGDFTITARMVSSRATSNFAKSGLMVRQNTTANAVHAFLSKWKSGTMKYQRRTVSPGSTVEVDGVSARVWMRLQRVGSVVTASTSATGSDPWEPINSAPITMSGPVLVGLATSSNNLSEIATTVFDSVSFAGLP